MALANGGESRNSAKPDGFSRHTLFILSEKFFNYWSVIFNLTSCQVDIYILIMIEMTVGDLKAQFSDVLSMVMDGMDVNILYGRSKKPVAKITRIEEPSEKRKIGTLTGKATFSEQGDGKISMEEFLGI